MKISQLTPEPAKHRNYALVPWRVSLTTILEIGKIKKFNLSVKRISRKLSTQILS